ncbi:MAG: carboxymuconolactone decarboxylase family protein, partial [Bacteroidota bacterium]
MERIGYNDIPQGMFEKLLEVEHFLNDSPIDIKLLELIRLRVGQINGCAYSTDMHYKELKHLGESELRLVLLSAWEDCPFFNDKEREVLRFTERITHISDSFIGDKEIGALLKFFNKSEISYLTLAIAQINTWTRLMKTFKFAPGKYQVRKN